VDPAPSHNFGSSIDLARICVPLRLADLLRHGLLRASFVPDRRQRELRDLIAKRSVRRLEELGFKVSIEEAVA